LYDVFFSYRRSDLARARPLLDALDDAGMRVWWDSREMPDNAAITLEIRGAIAGSKALIAFYSRDYPASGPCQQELTAAWTAAQQLGAPPYSRVLVINPEAGFDHIPAVLREQQSMGWASDAFSFAWLSGRIQGHVRGLQGALAPAGLPAMPEYLGMTPVQAALFVGRVRPLWDLHGLLTANRMSIITGVTGQTAVQVRGLGGNGKSLLAREYAIRFGGAYPGGVFWLNAYGNDDTKGPLDSNARERLRRDQIREFAIRAGVPADALKPEQVDGAFRRMGEPREPCLWVVDDLPSGIDPAEVQTRWHAPWSAASVLITTRSTEYGGLGSHFDLDVLGEGEALELLTARRRPDAGQEADAARRIAVRLGYHPLAVEVAGSYIAKGTQTYTEYLRDLDNETQDAVEFGARLRESLPTGHERSISGTLLRSIRMLGAEGTDFLRLASSLAVAPIPARLVETAFDEAGADPPVHLRVLEALDQADSLALCRPAGSDARLVHTLVSRTMRYHVGKDGRTAVLRLAATRALLRLLQPAANLPTDAEVAMEHARHIISGRITEREEAELAGRVGRLEHKRGDFAEARELEQKTVDALRDLVGEDHPDTLAAMNNLGLTLYHNGELREALQIQERAAKASARSLGETHPSTLTAIVNFAQTLYGAGDLPRAAELQRRAVEGLRALLGDDHPKTLTALNNLAVTLFAQGERAAARSLQERVLAARRRLGDEDPETLSVMNNLAQNLYTEGDIAGAIDLQREVLEARRRLLGRAHPDTLRAQANLALSLYAAKQPDEAIRLQDEVLQARRRLGEKHPETLLAMNSLAGMLYGTQRVGQARELQSLVFEFSRQLLGPEHPDTLNAANNLAVMMKAQGDLKAARELQERVLESLERTRGPRHAKTTTAAVNLLSTLLQSGDRAAAAEVLKTHLHWLVQADPATLAAEQRNARNQVLNFVKSENPKRG
jgi:tetratricopeptide (TPR) repeat protein